MSAVTREYQITIDFTANEYDMEQEGEEMVTFLRRVVRSYADGADFIDVCFKKGAEV